MDPSMMAGLFGDGSNPMAIYDSPMFVGIALHPRSVTASAAPTPEYRDGTFAAGAGGGVKIGYRLFPAHEASRATAPLVVHFHGNAEVAADYADGAYAEFHRAGASLLCVDFRGYGWSTGDAKLTTLGPDAEGLVTALPAIKASGGLGADVPVILFGRSIGSVCAIHLAANHGATFAGLILESAVAEILKLPMVQQIAMMMPQLAPMVSMLPDPFDNLGKIRKVATTLPLLVLHGDRDQIAPYSNGQALHDAAASTSKRIVKLEGAGHNDLTHRRKREYFDAVTAHVALVAAGGGGEAGSGSGDSAAGAGAGASTGAGAGTGTDGAAAEPAYTAEDVAGMSVKDMRRVLDGAGVSYVGVTEKSELRAMTKAALGGGDAEL